MLSGRFKNCSGKDFKNRGDKPFLSPSFNPTQLLNYRFLNYISFVSSIRLILEEYQGLIYLIFIALGVLSGIAFPDLVGFLESLLLPFLAFLLYSSFCQVPLVHLPRAFMNYKLIIAALLGNFLIIPIFVSMLLLPIDSLAVRLGISLVLFVPCTDWFITFSHIGKADTGHAIALTPIQLLFQIFLLPLYVLTIFPDIINIEWDKGRIIKIFLLLILLPLLLALLTQKLADCSKTGSKILSFTSWLPVPLLSLVVFVIFSSQVEMVLQIRDLFLPLTFVFLTFLLFALLLSKILSKVLKLPNLDGRVLAFTFGTRNSFVVLPIALALPEDFQVAVLTIVYQSLVELMGMLVFIKIVPRWVFPS